MRLPLHLPPPRRLPSIPRRVAAVALILAVLIAPTGVASPVTIDRPADREFVRDTAGLLSPAQVGELRQRCDQLLTDTAVPVFVVTLESIADHGGVGRSIESFAKGLFESWGDTHPLMHGQDWKRGILLIVAVDDQQLRVQLGPAWDDAKEREARRVVDEVLLPDFRRGDYSGGVLKGVAALDAMARDQPLPQPSLGAGVVASWSVVVGLVAVAIASLFHKGTARVSGRTARVLLALVPSLLYAATQPKRHALGQPGDSNGRSGRGIGLGATAEPTAATASGGPWGAGGSW